MTVSEFWSLLQDAKSKAGDTKSIPAWLEEDLATRSPAEIMDFGAWLSMFVGRAHDLQLWSAGNLIARGLSDDGFVYFKCWLIAQGKCIYEAALLNPDSLADIDYPDYQPERGYLGRPSITLEGLLYTYAFAYNRQRGQSKYAATSPPAGWLPPVGCEPNGPLPKLKREQLLGPDETRKLGERFPRLIARFPIG